MRLEEALRGVVEIEIARHPSLRAAATAMGVSPATLSRFVNGTKAVSLDTVDLLLNALGPRLARLVLTRALRSP